MPRPISYCIVNECNKRCHGLGYCNKHYRQLKDRGSLNGVRSKALNGQGSVDKRTGYRYVSIDKGQYRMLEHRYVMEQYLGRKLLENENVHHINGDRLDNRIENLELWSCSQPPGQRIEDKIKWAKEILQQYNNLQSEDDAHY